MTSTGQPRAEVYPRAPLAAVAIEVYFKPVLDALERFAKFQREHDADYPHVILPDDSGPRRMRAATLVHKTNDRAVAIGRDLVAAVTYQDGYREGFHGFKAWALPVLRAAIEAIAPSRVERLRYMYENEILLTGGGELDLSEKFTIVLPKGGGAGRMVRHLHLGWTQFWPGGSVDVRFESCPVTMSQPQLDLSLVAERKGPLEMEALEREVELAHSMARDTFEALITEAYRAELRKPKETN